MMAKDSVKKRLGSDAREGMSFTEFTYQLLQGYDFLHLYQKMDCKYKWVVVINGAILLLEQN